MAGFCAKMRKNVQKPVKNAENGKVAATHATGGSGGTSGTPSPTALWEARWGNVGAGFPGPRADTSVRPYGGGIGAEKN